MTKIATQNINQEAITRKHVVGVLREVFSDPDFGLSLRKSTTNRLKKSVQSKKLGRYKSLKTIISRYSK